MSGALGLYLVACAVLAVAGVAKAWRPAGTARAMAGLRPGAALRPMSLPVRVGAGVELGLGLAALAYPRPALAGAVAASYFAFAAFVSYARARGGVLATCGCFGTPDTPATALHTLVDLALGGAALVVAIWGPAGDVVGILAAQPLDGAPLVVASGVGTALVLLAMTSLARLRAAHVDPRTGRV